MESVCEVLRYWSMRTLSMVYGVAVTGTQLEKMLGMTRDMQRGVAWRIRVTRIRRGGGVEG
jgi:hypothetical protein